MIGSAQIIRADSRHLPFTDDSVDLIVTSPPYFALRSYQDGGKHYAGQIGDEPTPTEFLASLLEVTRECVRVLKPSGSLWVNLGDKYASSPPSLTSERVTGLSGGKGFRSNRDRQIRKFPVGQKSLIGIPWRYALACIDELGLILRAEVIWSKPNGLPESVKDRVKRSHEQWFHFTLSPRYFSAIDEIREEYIHPTNGATFGGVRSAKGSGVTRANATTYSGQNPLGKLPGSIWTIPTEPLRVPDHLGIDHFAAFPTEWPRRIIRGWCPEGGTVLDPFGGTGTTALVAKILNRHGISVDMSADYCRLAEWRTSDDGQMAKVLSKDLGITKNRAAEMLRRSPSPLGR